MNFTIENNHSPSTIISSRRDIICELLIWINKNITDGLSFKELLEKLNKNNGTNRSMSGLLTRYNIIENKGNKNPHYVITDFGKIYLNILRMYNLNEKNKNDEIEKQIEKQIEKMEKIFLLNGFFNFLKNGKNNNINYYDVIIWTLKFLLKWKEINKDEFAYLLYTEQNNKNFDNNIINGYRNGTIKINYNTSTSKGEKFANNQNTLSFSNIFNLIEETGIAYWENNTKYLRLNRDMYDIVKKMLEDSGNA